MRQFLVCLVVTLAIFTACGGDKAGWVGDACQDEQDCSVDICLQELSDDSVSPPWVTTFVNGMCTEECETPGAWYYDYEMCLIYTATGAQYLFNSCRNSLDCRADEEYFCAFVGWDVNMEVVRVCLPESAVKRAADGHHTSDIYTTGIRLK